MIAQAALHLDANHPAFAGHFPGRPIVPGALLIELALQAIEHASGRQVASIAHAKFLSPAAPGDALTLSFEVSGDAVHFDVTSDARKLASGRFVLHAAPA